jgi:prevent-host-death family protein
MVMSKVLPLSDVKARLSELIEEITQTHERLTVTRNGRPVAVLLATDDLEAIEDTLSVLSDPVAVAEIDEARAAIAAGQFTDAAELAELRNRLSQAS